MDPRYADPIVAPGTSYRAIDRTGRREQGIVLAANATIRIRQRIVPRNESK
ncbi:MAG TPA: hypothetical protein VGQ56_04135 [Gemmatimonadaceae bacterium]|nr:hypothetical protein [Gemmatimonadaceae bacterium]